MGRHGGAVAQRGAEAVWHGHALWDRAVLPFMRRVPVQSAAVAVSDWIVFIGRQAVILQNDITVIIFLVTVSLGDAAAVVRTHNVGKY